MQWMYFGIFMILLNVFNHSSYSRDFTNATGFAISVTGLTLNGGYPAIYQKTGNGFALVMTGVFLYTTYYCVSDEVKVIRHRQKGLWLK